MTDQHALQSQIVLDNFLLSEVRDMFSGLETFALFAAVSLWFSFLGKSLMWAGVNIYFQR